jgi:subtilisin family serine protease
MSQEKEYIVGLKKGIDFKKFDNEMIIATGNGHIPQRSVTVANQRPLSQRLTHYMLTDEEAENLRHDIRVECVEIPPNQRDDIKITPFASQSGNFSKTTSDSGPYINWGLRRVNEKSNVYGGSTIVSGDYNYTLDGSGVDFVVHDTGIQKDHPEFQDADGISRVKEIDWYTESGLTGTQNANHYRDTHGHGTHVAGTVAGKTYGYAKNADIYALKVNGLEGSGDSGTGISIADCFDVVKEWHRRKVSGTYTPTNATYTPATGVMVLTLGNHNFEAGEKIRIAPGSLTFTCGKDNFASNHSYPRSSGAPNTAGTDPFYNKDINIDSVTATTITINIGISSDTSEHRFVSALTGAVEATGDKRLLTKRPTVVNMSWGYTSTFVGISGGIYRGTAWSGTTQRTDYGMVGRGGRHPVRVSSVDIDLEELIDAGVHVTISAGNYKQKIDVEGGDDYDNLYYQFGFARYYHRGGSPHSQNAHIVGNIDSVVHTSGGTILEQKAGSSETGPGVTIWAPGTDIMSSSSNTSSGFTSDTYYFNSDFKQANISGTSMAAPQVAGVISLYLQINPEATPKEVKDWITNNAQLDDLYQPGDGTSYDNDRSLLGSSPRFLFNPYNSKYGLTLYSSRSGESSVSLSAPTYTMTASAAVINEGSSVTITLATENVANGTSVPYTITGISSGDITGGSLTGNFVVGTTDAITLEFISDSATEGNETATISLDNGQASVSILINDSSVAAATYALTSSASSIDEGGSVTITLSTTNVTTGTNLPYTITGINSDDLEDGSLTGLFVVGTTNTRVINLAADATTEGEETLTLTLDNGLADVDVIVNDTSETPPTPTYSLTTSASAVNEGDTFTITLNTTNVPSNTVVPYTITGVNSADISGASLTGSFLAGMLLNIQGQKEFTVTADQTTEGAETFTLTLDNSAANISVSINDTSTTPAGPSYSLSSSASAVDEGNSVIITLTTQNISPGTTLPYTISGVSSADISGASLTGNFTVGSSESVTLTIAADATTEGSEALALSLDNGQSSVIVTINDTSTTPTPTYALSSSADVVNEGSTFTITLSTTEVANGTNVAYTITGIQSADIGGASLTGAFNIQNNSSTLVIQTTADLTTEGNEILNLALDNDEDNVSVTITDSSQGSGNSYSASVTAPSSSYYSISNGNDRNGPVSGNNASFAVNDGDIITFNVNVSGHPFYIKTTPGTGTGNQASGVSGQGNTSGAIILNTTGYSGQTLYYQCSLHSLMRGSITIT